METLIGKIQRIIYENPESDFKVFTVRRKDNAVMRVTGDFPNILIGAKVELHGEYKNHKKYGIAFNSKAHVYDFDKNPHSIALYIQAIAKWVGPERSFAIANKFKGDLEKIIEEEPMRLTEIEGIGSKIAESIADAWQLNRDMKNCRVFLHSLGLSIIKIERIVNKLGADAENKIKSNPWMLNEERVGFGFTTCDHMAFKLGVDIQSPWRYRQFIFHALKQTQSSGHLFLYPQQLLNAYNKYNNNCEYPFKTGLLTIQDIAPHIKKLVEDGSIINDQNRLYPFKNFAFESEAARLLSNIKKEAGNKKFNDINIENFIKEYEKENSLKLPPDKKFELSDAQKDAIRSFIIEKILIVTGSPGTGKCLGKNTPVLMYDGSIKKVQDIIVGDILMGDDSTPRNVLSINSGIDNLYQICPKKGDPYIVNSEHILSLKESPDRLGYFKKGRIRDICLKDYFKLSKTHKHHLKGYRVPIEFEDKDVPIDPYIIGFWLGNGDKNSTRISTSFKEVIDYINNLIKDIGLSIKKVPGDNVDYDISCDRTSDFYKKLSNKKKPNIFLETLKNLNLISNKHIPSLYKINSREKRLKLLAGLIDSDGCADKGKGIDFLFTNKKLAKDILYLVKSLGYSAYLKECIKTYKCERKGKKYSGKAKSYRFYMSGNNLLDIPIKSKKRKPSPRLQKKDVLVTGIAIKFFGKGNYYGFEIDGNKRFLLGDFTVTHNTTVIKAFVEIMKKLGILFELLTPTGIAAKKLGDTAGCEAHTIHRRLGFRGSSWTNNSLNKYYTQVVIVDEVSMVDQEVLYRLLTALYSNVKIIFVGDNDQLPSVGPGSVLKELIESGEIKTIFLDQIFRQEECSEIIKEAKEIRDGNIDMKYFRKESKADIWFIPDNNDKRIENGIIKFSQQLKDIMKTKKDMTFQIISPRNQGPLSVETLNIALQKVLNPPHPEKKEVRLNEYIIRKGDRVIIRKNDYSLGVYNGDVGKAVSVTPHLITIDIEDFYERNRRVEIPLRAADGMIKLAYCLTIHKSQGMEYSIILLPFIRAHGNLLLQRNLIYTAITRAKKKVIVLGQASAIEYAIKNDKIQKRNTILGERIKQWMNGSGVSLQSMFSNSSNSLKAAVLKRLQFLESPT